MSHRQNEQNERPTGVECKLTLEFKPDASHDERTTWEERFAAELLRCLGPNPTDAPSRLGDHANYLLEQMKDWFKTENPTCVQAFTLCLTAPNHPTITITKHYGRFGV